jgi:hypothetical protein
MATLTRRWKQVGFAVALLAVGVIAEYAYLATFPPDVLTPRRARAALAEHGYCESDAPIREFHGTFLIGDWDCDLENKHFYEKSGIHAGVFYYVKDTPVSTPFGEIASPFGRWKATRGCILD